MPQDPHSFKLHGLLECYRDYCPACYESVRSKVAEVCELGIKMADAQYRQGLLGLLGALFGRSR